MEAFGVVIPSVLGASGGKAMELFCVAIPSVLATSVVGTAATYAVKKLIECICGNRDQGPESEGGSSSGGSEENNSSGGSEDGEPNSEGSEYGQDVIIIKRKKGQDGYEIVIVIKFQQFKKGITHFEDAIYWKCSYLQNESRFSEVAELLRVSWFSIEAKIKFSDLPLVSNTNYGVYLIFKIINGWEGLDIALEATIKTNDLMQIKNVCLREPLRPDRPIDEFPSEWGDGWMKLKLGQFFCDDNTRGQEVAVTLKDPNNGKPEMKEKKGLIIAGIELRPV